MRNFVTFYKNRKNIMTKNQNIPLELPNSPSENLRNFLYVKSFYPEFDIHKTHDLQEHSVKKYVRATKNVVNKLEKNFFDQCDYLQTLVNGTVYDEKLPEKLKKLGAMQEKYQNTILVYQELGIKLLAKGYVFSCSFSEIVEKQLKKG
jgi:hypothetical protein